MFEPGVECPECSGKLKSDGSCRDCGWKPAPVPVTAPSRLPQFRPFPERPRMVETDPVVREEILAMVNRLKSQFEVVAPAVRAKTVETFKRCPECEHGKFVHLGVRFCGVCYGRL